MTPLPSLALLLALPRAEAADVRLTGQRWLELLPERDPPVEPGPAPVAVSREVTLAPAGDEGVRVVARWRIDVPRPGAAVEWVLAGPELVVESVVIDGRSGPIGAGPQGLVFAAVLEKPVVIEVAGRVAGSAQRGVGVSLMPAGSGTTTLTGPVALSGGVPIAAGRYAGAPDRLALVPAPQRRADRPTLVLGETAVGVTVGEAEVKVAARLRWRVTDGEIDRVAFSVPGAGVDLVVRGPQVASWTRSGDRVEVVLLRPERSLVALEASFSTPAPQGETAVLPIPHVQPEGVFRNEAALQIARDGTVDVVPSVPGWQPTASSLLPEWGTGLVEGTPTAAFVGRGGPASLTLYRFTPADGPATLVDVAQYTLATTDEGRVLMRAHYAVRNDRGAVLRVEPPPGLEPIGVRVAGETATVARDGRTWLVPLAKSVETVEGLLSFPVELAFLGEIGEWDRREERPLALPTVDAEVAVTRVTVHLPPRYANRLKPGQGGQVGSFTEGSGITYGFAVGDARAAEADALFQSAVSAWMENEFEQAQVLLDELGELGADNDDVSRLQSNLSIVLGSETGKDVTATTGEDVLERRVKEQARARSQEELLAQEEATKIAEEAYNSGDYQVAEQNYRKALEIGEKLDKLANVEDEEQKQQNFELQTKLDKTLSTRKAKEETVAASGSSAVETIAEAVDDLKGEVAGATVRLESLSRHVVTEAPPADTGRGTVVTEEFLQQVPTGREYQSAIQMAPGVTGGRNPNMAGGAFDEEDRDGFEDEDGVPDADNDADGILDVADACPSEPETVNGDQDGDGCPDTAKVIVEKHRIVLSEPDASGQLALAEAAWNELQSARGEVGTYLARGRELGDVPMLECVNQRATGIEALARLAEDSLSSLATARSTGDAALEAHEASKLQVAAAKARQLLAEAGACGAQYDYDYEIDGALAAPEAVEVLARRAPSLIPRVRIGGGGGGGKAPKAEEPMDPAVRQVVDARPPPVVQAEEERRVQQHPERQARNTALLGSLGGRVATLRASIDARPQCFDAASLDELRMVLDQAQSVIDARDTDLAPDIAQLVDAYAPAVDQALADCGRPDKKTSSVDAGSHEVTIMSGFDSLAEPVVTAAALSVVVPSVGDAVLYQHLLLPAGATWEIPVRARETRRKR